MSDRHPLIRDRGRGPELVNSRITVFDLLPNLTDPQQTDADILAWYPSIDATQLAAIRAYALEFAEILLPIQREWEARPHPRNPPEVEAAFERGANRIADFRRWRAGGGELGPTREETRARLTAWLEGPGRATVAGSARAAGPAPGARPCLTPMRPTSRRSGCCWRTRTSAASSSNCAVGSSAGN